MLRHPPEVFSGKRKARREILMKKSAIPVLALVLAAFCGMAGCAKDEAKIDNVKKTVLPGCGGKTLLALTSELLQNPQWGMAKAPDGRETVTVKGTLAGDKLPAWVKEQKLMDITFSFPLDPKSGAYDPSALDGFPSLTSPEGILQAYKVLACS
jgi:hypothetical protein